MNQSAILICEKGLHDQAPIALSLPIVVFGKSPSADVTIDNQYISRRHFQIRYESELYYIRDLESTNGTSLNGDALEPGQDRRLRNEDQIAIAGDQVVLRFSDPIHTVSIELPSPKPVEPKELTVDMGSRDVWVRGQKLIPPLSRKEFDILALLDQNQGNAVTRDSIAESGWPERIEGDVTPEEIDQYISRLRRRIEQDPSKPSLIVTMRGFGYRFL